MSIVVITRPAADAAAVVEAVAVRGCEPLVEPMLTIEHLAGPEHDVTGAQAVLFTSANGVRAFASRTPRRGLPVYAVGDATAEAAEAAGFQRVSSASGTVDDLADLIVRQASPSGGRLIYACGRQVAGDLGRRIRAAGFSVDQRVVYVARPTARLSDTLERAMLSGTVSAALFFSPRSAAAFATLVRQAELGRSCRRVAALCISSATAESLKDVHWRTVAVATRPTQDAMIGLLDQECARIPQS